MSGNYDNDYLSVRERDIISGKYFTWQPSIAFTTGQVIELLFKQDADSEKIITADPLLLFDTAGVIRVDFYIGHNYTSDTEINYTTYPRIYNRNGNSSNKNSLKIYSSPTGSDLGYWISEISVGTQSTNQSSGGGTVQSPDKIVLNKNYPFLIRFTNNSGGAAKLNIILTWKEDYKKNL